MKRLIFDSLLVRVVLIVLAAVIPTLGITLYSGMEAEKQARLLALARAAEWAQKAAEDQDRLIGQAHQTLLAISYLPKVLNHDGPETTRLFAYLMKHTAGYAAFFAMKADGEVFATHLPMEKRIKMDDQSWFQKIVSRHRFVVGGYEIGRITGEPVAVLAYPAPDARGHLRAVVAASLNLEWIGGRLMQLPLPEGTSINVCNNDGLVLFRHPEPERFIGKTVQKQAIFKKIRAERQGATEESGLDGIPRLFGFATAGEGNESLHISVGIPVSVALAEVHYLATRNLVFLGFTSILALAVAWLGGLYYIRRPVHHLIGLAGQLAAGDLTARAHLPAGKGEIGELARAYNQMAESLEKRDREHIRMEEELRNYQDHLEIIVAERTEDLSRTNADLEREMIVRKTTEEDLRKARAELEIKIQERTAELRESEERYRLMVELSPGLIGVHCEGKWTFMNDSGARLLGGAGPADFLGRPVLDVIHPDYRQIAAERNRRVTDERRQTNVMEQKVVRLDGAVIEVEIANAPVTHQGKPAVQVFIQDITQRNQNEERLRRQMMQLKALRDIDMAITGSLDIRVTLAVFLDQATATLGVDAAAVLLLDFATHRLEFAAGRGFMTGALQHTNLSLGEGFAGQAAQSGRLVSIPDLPLRGEDLLARSPLLAAENFVAYYAVPLVAKGLVRGVLEIYHRRPLHPDTEWLDFLDMIGRQAAIAIDDASLFDNLQKSNRELVISYDKTLEGWSRALDMRDWETEGHSERVTYLTVKLARAMGIRNGEMIHIRRGALLHDIGKIGIPDNILHKPGPLNDEEWRVMKSHPAKARELLANIPFLKPALDIPCGHHEKWDGTGYPLGLKGEEIPEAARIFAIVDVYDALCSNRPYREAWPREKVCEHLRQLSGRHFDPRVVEVFWETVIEPAGKGQTEMNPR